MQKWSGEKHTEELKPRLYAPTLQRSLLVCLAYMLPAYSQATLPLLLAITPGQAALQGRGCLGHVVMGGEGLPSGRGDGGAVGMFLIPSWHNH